MLFRTVEVKMLSFEINYLVYTNSIDDNNYEINTL